ncbi:uncharacterized protein CLUP02_01827 [Colletotrichum lupini]|uniref:Uncharacterized protein n=1 Tax=Colletotrichum lupini TaxID=145971 RepID=A0A9Q8W9I9_9PEZI|nr:uncharacterized protein CLUP02_01827 [Colletotrichum lupini]UQC75174.1 hypothetical protein CLUP02_01827 [Colletotrichum lupini]
MAHSGQSAYSGYMIRPRAMGVMGEDARQADNQPASDEPTAYGAAFRSEDVAASETRHQARAAENIARIMSQYGGK